MVTKMYHVRKSAEDAIETMAELDFFIFQLMTKARTSKKDKPPHDLMEAVHHVGQLVQRFNYFQILTNQLISIFGHLKLSTAWLGNQMQLRIAAVEHFM